MAETTAGRWLPPTPPPLGKRLAVRVTSDALRQIRAGHPWLFDRAVTSVSHEGAAGDLAVVFDRNRKFAAIGLWDPRSPIRIKVLHHGAPRPIDGDFFGSRVAEALARRSALIGSGSTTAYRVVHGENDRLPGLVVDRYADVLVVKLYTTAWWPHLPAVVAALDEHLPSTAIVLRLARNIAADMADFAADGDLVAGHLESSTVEFLENGLRFTADVVRGQKTGHFLDQRDNRQRVRAAAADAGVLDVFCHTGGFSTYAAAGGARLVHSVDRSAPAIATATAHLRLNADVTKGCEHRTSRGDAFEILDALARNREEYDVVVIDPPSFAAREADVDAAVRAYRKLTELGLRVLAPGGLLVQASCSSRVPRDVFVDTVEAGVAAAGATLTSMEVAGHPVDHPIGFPEGAYLKAVFARISPGVR